MCTLLTAAVNVCASDCVFFPLIIAGRNQSIVIHTMSGALRKGLVIEGDDIPDMPQAEIIPEDDIDDVVVEEELLVDEETDEPVYDEVEVCFCFLRGIWNGGSQIRNT
jgi:hypothetical protein